MDKTELNDVIKFAKANNMMNWSFEEVLNEYETTKMHHKESKFNPSTFQPFDKVLARDSKTDTWECDIFSNFTDNIVFPVHCILYSYRWCIPYNDETKHLVCTTEDCPDYYKWWEKQL